MGFGRWPLRQFLAATRGGVAAAALAVLVAGCGGGGDGGTSPGPGGNATVTGRVVDSVTGAGIANVQLNYGDRRETSGPTGAFSFTVRTPAPAQSIKIAVPRRPDGTPIYYADLGQYGGRTIRIATEGVPVPEITSNRTVDLGAIVLYSDETPPPPPQL